MRKEGTGDPQNPDIILAARVRVRELYFEKAPNPEVCFRGNTGRNSVWESGREALPDRVREGVVYRDAEARLRIASETVSSDPDLRRGSGKDGASDPGQSRRETEAQKSESRREKENK